MCHLMAHITTLGELSEIIFQYGLNPPSSSDTRFVHVRIPSKMSAKQNNHWLIIYNMVLSRWAKQNSWQCITCTCNCECYNQRIPSNVSPCTLQVIKKIQLCTTVHRTKRCTIILPVLQAFPCNYCVCSLL